MLEFIAFIIVIYLLYDIRTKVVAKRTPELQFKDPLVFDTSALIDGRMLSLFELRYMQGKVILPAAVLNELQMIADRKGSYDRRRALIGLENAKKLQTNKDLAVEIAEISTENNVPVDSQVIDVALASSGRICTTDVGLQKRAEAQGCTVLNVNQLASSIRLKVHVGDVVRIKIVSKGDSRAQGIGYTEEGVMIVVEQAAHLIGKYTDAVVQKTLQTPTGQTAFAKLFRG